MTVQPARRAALPEWLEGALRIGLIGGILAVFTGLEGIYVAFNTRFIIARVLTMGQLLTLLIMFLAGYLAITRGRAANRLQVIGAALVGGLLVSMLLVVLVLVGSAINLGAVFVNAVPDLYKLLTLNQGVVNGSVILLLTGVLTSALAAGLYFLPAALRRLILLPLGVVIAVGLFQDLITTTLSNFIALKPTLKFLFAANGLSPVGAVSLLVLVVVLYYLLPRARANAQGGMGRMAPRGRATVQGILALLIVVILLTLPSFIGIYLSQVLDTVGLYILLGLGLNIVVGLAGLLDLGYVAFFAIGAYTVGVLTSPDLGHAPILATWWEAVPFAVLAGLLAGVLLGIPVLKVRGDYLAIVTLGFGEIIRLLALSDFLKPIIGGAQGVLEIGRPIVLWVSSLSLPLQFGTVRLVQPQQFYYIILLGCLLVAVISTRLKDSRLGRAWMAMREDEDVAEGMGIELVSTKLLAFGMGASFGGLSGAIFGSQVGSAFPNTFTFLVSVNILSLIIIGGMGNIPGVIVGAFALVGLPELLREFSDYRFLFYGASLVLMMLTRPEGLLPEARRREELEEFKEEEQEAHAQVVPVIKEDVPTQA